MIREYESCMRTAEAIQNLKKLVGREQDRILKTFPSHPARSQHLLIQKNIENVSFMRSFNSGSCIVL